VDGAGSVEDAAAFFGEDDEDGFCVGGATLDEAAFLRLIMIEA